MEMSHRSKVYLSIFEETKANFKRLFNVPDTHEILFLGGGATLQFAMVAMNLISGVGNDMLAPNATATRAQAARMIMIYTTLEFSVVEPAE